MNNQYNENDENNQNNSNHQNNQPEQENHEATKKLLGVAEKGAEAYFTGGKTGIVDTAKKAPVIGKQIDKAEDRIAETLDKVPGVKEISKGLNDSGITDMASKGLDLLGKSPNGMPNMANGMPQMPTGNAINNNNVVANNPNNNSANNNSANNNTNNNSSTNNNLNPNPPGKKNGNFQNNVAQNNEAQNSTVKDNSLESKDGEKENAGGRERVDVNISTPSTVVVNTEDSTDDEKKEKGKIRKLFDKLVLRKIKFILLLAAVAVLFIFLLIIVIIGAGFEQLKSNSNSYSYNSICSTGTGGSLASFVASWEGVSGDACTINGLSGNRAADEHDGAVTVGPGVTNALLGSVTEFIEQNNYGKYFKKSDGRYYMDFGDCIPTQVSEELKEYALQAVYGAPIESTAARLGLSLTKYQVDALTSFNYNLGAGYTTTILTAYRDGGLEGLWDKMKQYTKNQGNVLAGLQKRRKGEFALFVTGDYSDQNLFYSRDLTNYDDYNSEGVMDRVNVCSGAANEAGLVASANGFMKRIQRPLRSNAYFYDPDTTLAYTDFEGECSWYAGHRAKEILASVGSSKSWGSMPDGGNYCTVSEVTSGEFKISRNVNMPQPGSLISWSKGNDYGHVAVVEEVYDDGSILISEGFVSLGIYGKQARDYINIDPRRTNRKKNCEGNGSGCFQTRRISASQIQNAGWNGYSFNCYIYLVD